MKSFTTWSIAHKFQMKFKSEYDNGLTIRMAETGIDAVDKIPFVMRDVVWLVMSDEYSLGDYEESATEYGITKEGKWVALYDGHCSCNGWDATHDNLTFYATLDELIAADGEAKVILAYWHTLLNVYPFLKDYFITGEL